MFCVLYLTDLSLNLFVLYNITDFRIIIGNQFVFDKKDKLTKKLSNIFRNERMWEDAEKLFSFNPHIHGDINHCDISKTGKTFLYLQGVPEKTCFKDF